MSPVSALALGLWICARPFATVDVVALVPANAEPDTLDRHFETPVDLFRDQLHLQLRVRYMAAPANVSSNALAALRLVGRWVAQDPEARRQADVAAWVYLSSGFANGAGGAAWVGSACGRAAVAVATPDSLAHELGHLFGFAHAREGIMTPGGGSDYYAPDEAACAFVRALPERCARPPPACSKSKTRAACRTAAFGRCGWRRGRCAPRG